MTHEVIISDRRSLHSIFPALRLVGAIRQAFDLRKLIIAALGLSLVRTGWSFLGSLLGPITDNSIGKFTLLVSAPDVWESGSFSMGTIVTLPSRVAEPFRHFATLMFVLVDPASGWTRMLHAALCLIWSIVVWGICGGAICRIAIVQVAALRQMSVIEAMRFTATNAGALILAPLCPLLGVAFCGLICALIGLTYRLPAVGPALVGIGLFVPLAAGLVMTLLVAGLIGGWPLLQAATAGGAEDALDALSRIFGYLNQRLGSYVALVALAWMGGIVGLALVDLLTAGVLQLTQWGLGLGAPLSMTQAFFSAPADPPAGVAAATHGFWIGLAQLIAHSWIYSFYWTAAANLYLWLRHEIDGTPWTEFDPAVSPAGPPRT